METPMKHKHIFVALAALSAIPLGMRQATPCQQQQAGPSASDQVDALSQNLDDMSDLADQYIKFVVDADGIQADLKKQIADLVAGDTTLAGKIDAVWNKSEALENKLREKVPGLPPIGGTPLLQSYAARADFDAAVAAYTGPESVTVDGSEVKSGTTPALDYFTHSADGSVSTTGPTD